MPVARTTAKPPLLRAARVPAAQIVPSRGPGHRATRQYERVPWCVRGFDLASDALVWERNVDLAVEMPELRAALGLEPDDPVVGASHRFDETTAKQIGIELPQQMRSEGTEWFLDYDAN